MSEEKISKKQIDSELVKRALARPDDFILIIEKYEKPLRRYIKRMIRGSEDELDIILQDIFIKTYENLNDFDQDLTFSSWIYRIAHNESIDYIRKKKFFGKSLDEEAYDEDTISLADTIASDDDVIINVDKEFLKRNINKILEKMDPKYKSVLILKFLEEKDYNEISDIIKKPPGTVATLIHRAKSEFKEIAKQSGLSKELM